MPSSCSARLTYSSQVIIATLLSAWVSFVVVVIVYLQQSSWKSERLDEAILNLPERIRQTRAQRKGLPLPSRGHSSDGKSRPRLLKASMACVQSFSDQQLAIGLGLLITSYIQHCSITQYHFYLVYWLAWLSNTIHQSASQVLSQHQNQASPNVWRAALIFCLWPLLSASLIVVWNDHFLWVLGLSTQCIWDDSSRLKASNWVGMIVEQVVLAWSMIDTLSSYSNRVWAVGNRLNKVILKVFDLPGLMLLRIRRYRGQPLPHLHSRTPSWRDKDTVAARSRIVRFVCTAH